MTREDLMEALEYLGEYVSYHIDEDGDIVVQEEHDYGFFPEFAQRHPEYDSDEHPMELFVEMLEAMSRDREGGWSTLFFFDGFSLLLYPEDDGE